MSSRPAAEQNPEVLLKRVKDTFGESLDKITEDLTQSMIGILNDEYCYVNPEAKQPIQGVNYQEDEGSICFEMSNGESIFMKPVWVPVLYLDDESHPDNLDKLHLKEEEIKKASQENKKIQYSTYDWYSEQSKDKKTQIDRKQTQERKNKYIY